MKIKPQVGGSLRLYSSGRGLYPAVTDVLKVISKPYFDNWAAKVGKAEAEKVKADAAVFGTRVHKLAERLAWCEPFGDAEMAPYAGAVGAFLEKHVAEAVGTEMELVAPYVGDGLGFGGTLDLYCRLKDGSLAVVDYKTTASLTREHGLQLAAYAYLARKNGFTVNRRLCVRIKKDRPGEFYVRRFENHSQDVQAFIGLLRFWWWRHAATVEKRRAS